MEAMDDWPQQGQTTRAASTLGGGPHTLSEALRAILYPNESAHTLFKRARTKPFRTGLEIFDLAEQFMYGGAAPPPPADNSNENSERDLVHSHSGREEISASAGGEALTSTSNRGGIRGGDVVEFYGKTGSGKTEMLLHIVASTILPSTWSPSSTSTTTSSSSSGGSHQRLELDGEGAGAIFFDNDLKFDILRLERVLRARIRIAVAKLRQQRAASRQKKTTRSHRGAASRKRQRVADNDNDDEAEEEGDVEAEWPSAEDEDELVRACLARLTVFRCEDSLQFLATLQMTDELIRNYAHTQQQQQPRQSTSTTSTTKGKEKEKEKETRKNGAAAAEVKVIVIDSIGAFHNADRYAEPYGGGGFGGKGGYYGGGSRSRMNKVVLALKQLVNAHNLIVFAGKGAPFGKLTRNTVMNPVADPHQEFLGDAWQNFVKYRLLLVREEEGLGGRPSFWACINKPSLTLSLPAATAGGAASGADRSRPLGGGVTRVRTRLFPFTMTTSKGLSFQEL